MIAKAEIELITLNKHRGAAESLAILEEEGSSDWEIPLGVYFKKQNLSAALCEELNVKSDAKGKTHMMIEALSVLPAYRKQGIAAKLLKDIAKNYPKVQSINVLSMPMNLFVDADSCEDQANADYYGALDLANDTTTPEDLHAFMLKADFVDIQIDESLLVEPLGFQVYVTSPVIVLAD